MKLTIEDKKKIIEIYTTEGIGYSKIGKRIGCSSKVVEFVIKQYKIHGDESLYRKKKNNNYSFEFKKNIIDRFIKGESITSLTIEFNLNTTSTIRRWIKIYNELGYNGLEGRPRGRPKIMTKKEKKNTPLTNEEREEFDQLKKKLEYLEMENEVLKKLDALVKERLKRQEKKK